MTIIDTTPKKQKCPHCQQDMPASTPAQPAPTIAHGSIAQQSEQSGHPPDETPVQLRQDPPTKTYESWRDRDKML
jgi:hypothetical protein